MDYLDGNLGGLLELLTREFNYSLTPKLDAQVLLAQITKKNRAWVLTHEDFSLTKVQKEKLAQAFPLIMERQPLPYILGQWEFFNLNFAVNPNVLIPRPETELLVETAIEWLRENPNARKALDIGTGSGCIAISLLVSIPDLIFTATDISIQAIITARKNAVIHKVLDRLTFIQGDLFDNVYDSFDLITANLPYIPTNTLKGLDIFNKEPTIALNGGFTGLSLIRRFINESSRYLLPNGLLLFEIEANQGDIILEIVRENYECNKVSLHKDLSGKDRMVRIQT